MKMFFVISFMPLEGNFIRIENDKNVNTDSVILCISSFPMKCCHFGQWNRKKLKKIKWKKKTESEQQKRRRKKNVQIIQFMYNFILRFFPQFLSFFFFLLLYFILLGVSSPKRYRTQGHKEKTESNSTLKHKI